MEDSKKPKLVKEFQTLKTAISGYYRGNRYKWLRCCLYGIVPGAELDRTDVGANLFNALDLHGKISPTNVGILSEITKLTCVQDAIDCVTKYKQDNKCKHSKVKILTPYRRGLVKALMNAGKDEFKNVVGNYEELNPFSFDDLWDAVFKLEKARLLTDNPEKIQRFVNLLEESTKELFLGEIVAAGAQGISPGVLSTSLSPTNQPSTLSRPSLSPATLQGTSSGPSTSSLSPANLQDEEIRKYLLERQKTICANYNRFTPPIMQSRFQLDIAHMFTDLDLLKENNMQHQDATPITLDGVLDIIKNKPACKMLIEGEGGIGKTTLLSYLANNWSIETSGYHLRGKIVFFVNIRDLGEGEDVLDIIVKQIKLKDFNLKTDLPEDTRLIKKFIINHDDEIVLMLDGLDELKTGSESPISIFEKKEFKRSTVILTSRSEHINEFIKKSDVHVKVNGFSKRKVQEYIKKYFKSQLGDTLITKLSSGKHPELWSMCRNPMLLLLICIMWEERQEIPSVKADLFQEIFRCILNQYNKVESKSKICTFEDIPKQYVNAMCSLGQCMYHGLKKNQLSISKRDLVGNEKTITSALKLGFVYKDETFEQTNFEEIYAASHKLIVESLVGFYLCKICDNTGDMPKNLSLNDKEWEEIRENHSLQNAREFAIGFLGSRADKFLMNCITNSLGTLRTVSCKYVNYVKQEHVVSVLKSVAEYIISANFEPNQYLPDLYRSLKIFLNYLNPNADVNENILLLMRNIYETTYHIDLSIMADCLTKKRSEKGKILAHILLAVRDQKKFLKNVCKELSEKEEEYFLDECKKIDIKLDFFDYEIYNPIPTTLFLVYLLTHSIFLQSLTIEGKWNIGNILNDTMKMISNGAKLKLRQISFLECNLSNIDGASLASLICICPQLEKLQLYNCNLSGDVINAMLTDSSSRAIKLQHYELSTLDFSRNNLSNIDDSSLASLLDTFPNVCVLKIPYCNLKGSIIIDMIRNFSSRDKKLKLHYFEIDGNNLSNIDGASMASLMKISPHLTRLFMNSCHLTGDVINCMVKECRHFKFTLTTLSISNNNLSNIDYTSLALLMNIFPELDHLAMENCNLTGDMMNDMIRECSSRRIKSELELLDISKNNLSNIDGRSLASLMGILSPEATSIYMNCNLTGDVMNDMIRECSSRRIKLHIYKVLNTSDDYLDIELTLMCTLTYICVVNDRFIFDIAGNGCSNVIL